MRGDPGKIGRNAVVWDEVIAIVLNCLDKSYWTSFLVSFCPPNPIKPSSEAVTGKIQNRLRFSGENELIPVRTTRKEEIRTSDRLPPLPDVLLFICP